MIETYLPGRRVEGLAPADPGGTRWVQCVAPTPDEIERLAHEFHIHPLAVEDIQTRNQRPKVDDYGSQIFVVLFAAVHRPDTASVDLHEVHILVGHDYMVTFCDCLLPQLSALGGLCCRRADICSTPGGLFHRLCDAVIDSFFPILDELQTAIDDMETSIVERADRSTVTDIFRIKRELNTMRRVLGPQRDLLQGLAGPHGPLLGAEAQLYLRDVYDHAVRIVEHVDADRDIVTAGLDVYLTSVSNRLAEQTRRLSVVASVFLPLTFFTGFFGQNFGWLTRHIDSTAAFAIGVSCELLSVALIWLLVQRLTLGARPVPDEDRPGRRLTLVTPRRRRPGTASGHPGERGWN
jgi:magnesium transporter